MISKIHFWAFWSTLFLQPWVPLDLVTKGRYWSFLHRKHSSSLLTQENWIPYIFLGEFQGILLQLLPMRAPDYIDTSRNHILTLYSFFRCIYIFLMSVVNQFLISRLSLPELVLSSPPAVWKLWYQSHFYSKFHIMWLNLGELLVLPQNSGKCDCRCFQPETLSVIVVVLQSCSSL